MATQFSAWASDGADWLDPSDVAWASLGMLWDDFLQKTPPVRMLISIGKRSGEVEIAGNIMGINVTKRIDDVQVR